MAAPLGFKTFNTGDVLSAADTNGYLMQGIWVFASAAARDAAVTSPQEGNSCYLKDTDVIQVYSGSSWVTKSGGSSPLTTKGDLYTYSTTDARLPVGANGTTLVANSSTATGLEWATPASGGGMTSLASGSIAASATGFDLQSISGAYNDLVLYIRNYSPSTSANLRLLLNNNSSADYTYIYNDYASTWQIAQGQTIIPLTNSVNASTVGQAAWVVFPDYKNTTSFKSYQWFATRLDNEPYWGNGFTRSTSAIDRITVSLSTGQFDAGTYELFGVK